MAARVIDAPGFDQRTCPGCGLVILYKPGMSRHQDPVCDDFQERMARVNATLLAPVVHHLTDDDDLKN